MRSKVFDVFCKTGAMAAVFFLLIVNTSTVGSSLAADNPSNSAATKIKSQATEKCTRRTRIKAKAFCHEFHELHELHEKDSLNSWLALFGLPIHSYAGLFIYELISK